MGSTAQGRPEHTQVAPAGRDHYHAFLTRTMTSVLVRKLKGKHYAEKNLLRIAYLMNDNIMCLLFFNNR